MKTLNSIKELTVIELSTVLAGPSVGMFFAELGAKVIKIEHPTIPDVTRSWKLPSEQHDVPVSAYFSSVNYGKSYLTLNLLDTDDYSNFIELIKNADILLTNFKRGDDHKLGIETKKLQQLNKRLIIGKISGFGEESDRVAYDLILQAETGFMSMNGTTDSGPVKMPVALIDILAGHQLKEGILLALMDRQLTGKGSEVSVSLYDAAVCSLANQASNFLMTGHIAKRMGSLHPNIAPYGELFQTKDGVTITFAIGSDQHFEKLVTSLNHPELAQDNRFIHNIQRIENRSILAEILQSILINYQSEEIISELLTKNVPCAEVKSIDSVFSDKKAQELILTEKINGLETKRVQTTAFKFNHD
jgi:crotonobetainyl-CoA:carnitine CoA-transferase CaiB-like acyl-CoA transferase